MDQMWQQRQLSQPQRVIITQQRRGCGTQSYPQQQEIHVNTISSAFEPPPSYNDVAKVYPQQNNQFPPQPPSYGANNQQQPFHYGFSPQQQPNQPVSSVPIAGQNSGFTNNAFN